MLQALSVFGEVLLLRRSLLQGKWVC